MNTLDSPSRNALLDKDILTKFFLDYLSSGLEKTYQDIQKRLFPALNKDYFIESLTAWFWKAKKNSIDAIFAYCESEIELLFCNALLVRTLFDMNNYVIYHKASLEDGIDNTIRNIVNAGKIHISEFGYLSKKQTYKFDPDVFVYIINNWKKIRVDFERNPNRIDKYPLVERIVLAMEYMQNNPYSWLIQFKQYNAYNILLQGQIKGLNLNISNLIRPDIFIFNPCISKLKLVIELDGQLHHSDEVKFTTDRQRDRKLKSEGYDVLRFSGKEIFKNPYDTVDELISYMKKTYPIKDIYRIPK